MPQDRNPILNVIKSILSIPDLRNRVLFMLGVLAVCRMGAVTLLKAVGGLAFSRGSRGAGA